MDGANIRQKNIGKGQLIWGRSARQTLLDNGVQPDFQAAGVSDKGTIDWIHRETDEAEIYFIASRWAHPEKIKATFRVAGKQPELWDPVSGDMRDAAAFQQVNGRTTVPLEFNPSGSTFVMFRKSIATNIDGQAQSNYPKTKLLSRLADPWTVNFDPKWGGPEKVVFDQLTDWTNRPEPGIKYYSGTAVYHQTFELPAAALKNNRLLIDLGEVHEVASVRLNGHDLGVIWTKPARVDITAAGQPGKNNLEISVVNLWPNRLGYDESLPKDQRLTESNIHKFSLASPLLPSGLIGPVNLLTIDR
jgi:hypothetical protein